MAVLMTLEVPAGTTAQYDRTREIVGADAPPGLIAHACAVSDDGLLIADVWESVGALDDFVQAQLNAAFAEVGMPDRTVRISPVHDLILGTGKEPNSLVLLEAFGMTSEVYDGIAAKMPSHAGSGETHPSVLTCVAVEPEGIRIAGLWASEAEYKEFAANQLFPAVDNPRHFVLRIWPVHDCLLAQSRTPA